MTASAFIFARGGSKGVPRKNVKLLNGVPLIAYSIRVALACPSLGRVVVSTDDEEIAEVARQYGADVPFLRPAALATDTAAEWHAWRHAITWVTEEIGPFDTFVSLPPTSPFRSADDVESCLTMLANDPDTDVVITAKVAERSPYFNMVTRNADNSVHIVIQPDGQLVRRQDAPKVYDMTTVAYVARSAFVMRANGLFDGKVQMVEVPAERAIDIDTSFDFMIADFIARDLDGRGSQKD